ncbi:MAG TPA: FAD-dependent oxidoreductase [Gaiellaceae bacterium]|nr:FAD-dependent oxidoreductase [Gaiellaceae bacterium]
MSAGIVVVGGGLAAARVVKAYREAGGADPIRMLTGDSSFPYHRPPLSKRYLRGEIDADGTLVEQPGFYSEHDCRCDLETTVVAVRDSEVELSSGEGVPFERLVIASGASARQLDVPGSDLEGVFTLRTLANSTAIRERAAESRRAFIVGSNFIGLETAASLTQLGLQVTLCDRGRQLFRALETPAYSEYLRELYGEKGVELLFEDEVAEIRGDGEISSVLTREGEERDADLLIAGIGVAPNTGFLEGAGVDVDDGVIVNARFETSREGVYAVGDVARFHDPVFGRQRRIEHWSNASYQGGELGKLLAGEGKGYDTVSSFFSEIFGASIRFFGDATGHDDVVQHGDFADGKAVCLHTAGGRIVAALTMGQEDEVNDRIKELIRARAPSSEFEKEGWRT